MIAALILAVAVVGQPPSPTPAPSQPLPPTTFKAVKPAAKKALTKGQAQSQNVVDRRRARRTASAQRDHAQYVQDVAQAQADQIAYEKAARAQREYEIKMGPIWAAQNANAIQAQRNALISQRNSIESQKAANEAWIAWQLSQRSR